MCFSEKLEEVLFALSSIYCYNTNPKNIDALTNTVKQVENIQE